MDLMQLIRSYGKQPITHQLLIALLKDYKRPNDKIHDLLKEGILSPLKRGMYVVGTQLSDQIRPEPFLVANHLLGPSYVSSDTALSFHGLIPERVFEITSVTIKASRNFPTPMGLFSYERLGLPYYTFGIQQIQLGDEQWAMMASPEKSLLDKIVTTSGVVLRSAKAAESYLLEDLRIDADRLKELDVEQMSTWMDDAPKRDSLIHILKMIKTL
ncbi:type IV toxin-antitoxin system AbiEi family antitoxin domain-containing protein [Pedobacter frigoris]|uniref:Transcriptional regulator, AbiEi antitoxin, Type IV TA system n=1 Tax=Pedobacter frigoris TaxID=2571272 RepID=A0A4U1CV24_9SPHI|nr:hypothetical protein [Pedobacter frigoris]TKC09658.1 hypothetical protein FA047_06130 [Pedobacter frigoris]